VTSSWSRMDAGNRTTRVEAEPGWGQLVALPTVAIAPSWLQPDTRPRSPTHLQLEEWDLEAGGLT